MRFKGISKIWAEIAPRKRVVFSWTKRALKHSLSLLKKLPRSARFFKRLYPKALVGVYALFILFSPFAQIGTAHAPVLAAEEIRQIKQDKAEQKLRRELRRFLNKYHSDLGSSYIEALIAVERKHRIKGFSKLATAVALNESYLGRVYPDGSYNLWGLGATSRTRWIDYDSWKEGATGFYQLIKRLGLNRVNYQDLLRISRAYVGTSKWQQWGNKIWRFYSQI